MLNTFAASTRPARGYNSAAWKMVSPYRLVLWARWNVSTMLGIRLWQILCIGVNMVVLLKKFEGKLMGEINFPFCQS